MGGTGLYIDSFFNGLSEIPGIDMSIRDMLYKELKERSLKDLHDELVICDPYFGARVHPNDRQRIIRGLEVFRSTGKPISSFHDSKDARGSAQTLYIGLYEDRHILHERIVKRVDKMMHSGLIDEVRSIREMGYGPELKSMKSIGYAEINSFIDGAYSLDEAVEKIKMSTKHYAKRQMTWFKKNHNVTWFKPGELNAIIERINQWLDESSGYNLLNI